MSQDDKRRLGTIISPEAWEALGQIALHTPTTNSKTVSILIEDWLCRTGLLKEEERMHDSKAFKAVDTAARKAGKAKV